MFAAAPHNGFLLRIVHSKGRKSSYEKGDCEHAFLFSHKGIAHHLAVFPFVNHQQLDFERSMTIQDLFLTISSVSDGLQSGETNREYRDLMSYVALYSQVRSACLKDLESTALSR